jgi:hypothetical protein
LVLCIQVPQSDVGCRAVVDVFEFRRATTHFIFAFQVSTFECIAGDCDPAGVFATQDCRQRGIFVVSVSADPEANLRSYEIKCAVRHKELNATRVT